MPKLSAKLLFRTFYTFLLIFCFCYHAEASDSILTKPNLKVLDIGNSYTDDATAMLPLIVKYSGADVSDMCLYSATRGSGSFKTWYDKYYDNDTISYTIAKVLGGIDANITTGTEEGYTGRLFREVLEKEKWDLIIIHQLSRYAPYYDEWGTTGKGGYLNEFLDLIKELQPQATIGFLLVHSYWDEYSGNKEKSSYERWKKIADSVKRLCEDYSINFVIPYGTAIENLRSSSLNNEYDLTRDGTHCSFGLGRYAAACCYYESLIAPRSGISVLGNPARYNASKLNSKYPAISVTDENALLAQKAAVCATERWYDCLNPELLGEKFRLTYMVDSVPYRSYELEYGSKITPVETPNKDLYTFSGWDGLPEIMPDHDVIVNGSFSVNKYHLIYQVDSVTYKNYEIEYGTPIIPEDSVVREGYTFSGWSEVPDSMPAHDVIVNGSLTVNKYAIRYYVDGALYLEDWVEYGSSVVLRDYELKYSNRYSYKWLGDIYETMPAHDIKYTIEIIDAIPDIYIKASDSILTKPNLKVLDIGNSYTNDATAMLPLIVKYSGADVSDMCLYKAYRGGASFKNWYDRYYEKDDYKYSISKVLGGINANITLGSEDGNSGRLFREVLENEKWDLIIIHQVSQYAPYYDEWGTTGKGGYLNEFLNLLISLQPQAAIGFLLVHSYWDEYSGNKEKSSYERWKKIADSVRKLTEEYPISFVIPYGTAIENLRSSSLNNEYDLTKDGSHCGLGLCQYTAACCYYESLIAPRTGISILGNLARYDTSNAESKYPSINVTDQNALLAQKAAVCATGNWYECFNPDTLGEKYMLTYMVDDNVYKRYEIEHGSVIIPEVVPTKDFYTFSGWSELPVTMPAHDVTVKGSFTINKYNIVYQVDSLAYKTYEIDYGSPIIPEDSVVREGYTFSGWSEVPDSMPAHDVIVNGSLTVNKYNLVYQVDSIAYKTYEIDYGTPIIPEDSLVREGYTFSGWSEIPDTMPAHDVIVNGSFKVNKYAIRYYVDETLYLEDWVEYGSSVVLRDYELEDSNRYSYKWIGDIYEVMPAHDINYTIEIIDAIPKIFKKETVDIFTIHGIKVRTQATSDDVRNLPSGMYIIGGKKLMVK